MYDIGQRVRIIATGRAGIVIGHLGPHSIVSLDGDPTETVLVQDGGARVLDGQQRARAVVVHPSGRATPLSRRDTERVKVR